MWNSFKFVFWRGRWVRLVFRKVQPPRLGNVMEVHHPALLVGQHRARNLLDRNLSTWGVETREHRHVAMIILCCEVIQPNPWVRTHVWGGSPGGRGFIWAMRAEREEGGKPIWRYRMAKTMH